jgi:hypothetical protein
MQTSSKGGQWKTLIMANFGLQPEIESLLVKAIDVEKFNSTGISFLT